MANDRTLQKIATPLTVVVGYQGEAVARLARSIRPNVNVLFNENWEVTKTAASLSLGAATACGRCISLDGDLLVAPADFAALLAAPGDIVGVAVPSTSHPLFARVDQCGRCVGFSYTTATDWEWTGLVNFDATQLPGCQGNVFEMIDCLLPVATLEVQCVEVDTPEDLRQAEARWPAILCSAAVPNGQE